MQPTSSTNTERKAPGPEKNRASALIHRYQRAFSIGSAATFIVFFILCNYIIDLDPTTHRWIIDLAWSLAALAAALRCFATARQTDVNEKLAWVVFGSANLSWFLGMLVWDYQELVKGIATPFPGISDIGFLLFAPLMSAGLIAYNKKIKPTSFTIKQLGELGLIFCTIIISLIIILYQDIINLKEPPLYLYTALAYPVLYMGAFFLGLHNLISHPQQSGSSFFLLLLTGLGIHALTDTFYAHSLLGRNYFVGDHLDILWVIGFAFIFIAASERTLQTSPRKKQLPLNAPIQTTFINSLLVGICLIWLATLLLFFRESFTPEMTSYILPFALLMAFFISVISWSQHKLQEQLYDELLTSKNALLQANNNLEARVASRTQELETSKNEALMASNAKSEFLSRMSHELRTPLNAVLGFAQVLEIDAKLSKEQAGHVNEIIGGGTHLLMLINDILDLQRIEASQIKLTTEKVDIATVINNAIELTQHLTEKKQVTINNEITDNTRFVYADNIKLKQILINLISNAIKYNRTNGSITISNTSTQNNHLRIMVSDTGIGIAEENIEQIFEPFFRLRHDIEEGMGIGLAVCRKLIEAMNGRMGVESSRNNGSTFWIELIRP